MRTEDVDFTEPLFGDHPYGLRSPAAFAELYLLAWSLELKERKRISPHDPFNERVFGQLPARFRYDTLGELVHPPAGSSPKVSALNQRGRLVLLCMVWHLFDELDATWQLADGDFSRFANVLAFVTGGRERPSLFNDSSADLAKCLLADRVARTHAHNPDLTIGEEWFATGDPALLTPYRGTDVVVFTIGGNPIPMSFPPEIFAQSIWSIARVMVDAESPEFYLSRLADQTELLLDVLDRGAALAERRESLPPVQAWSFNVWPGWTTE